MTVPAISLPSTARISASGSRRCSVARAPGVSTGRCASSAATLQKASTAGTSCACADRRTRSAMGRPYRDRPTLRPIGGAVRSDGRPPVTFRSAGPPQSCSWVGRSPLLGWPYRPIDATRSPFQPEVGQDSPSERLSMRRCGRGRQHPAQRGPAGHARGGHAMTAPVPGVPNWVDLATADLDDAKRFYTALFGWEVEVSGDEYGGYTTFPLNGLAVAGAGPLYGGAQPTAWSTYIATADADAVAARVDAAGGKV